MATRDFRTQQIRATQIIASGTSVAGGATPSLLIYSASAAADDQGAMDAKLLTNVDPDAWLFISGSTHSPDKQNVTFGGNVGISGSLTGSSFTSYPGGDITLDSNDDLFLKSGGVEFLGIHVSPSSQDRVVINENSADIDFVVESNSLQSAIHVNANQDLVILGRQSAAADLTAASSPPVGSDVNVFIDGTKNSKDSGSRGATLIGGDLVVSGTLYAEKQVMEVDLSQTGQLMMSGAVHFKNLGAAPGATGQTGISVAVNDGAIFVSTGSLFLRTTTDGSTYTENKVGQGYLAGLGLEENTVGSSTTFFTDDQIVAHLTGSEFNGTVGVTGTLGVASGGNFRLAQGVKLFTNGVNATPFITSPSSTQITVDAEDTFVVEADTTVQIYAGDATGNYNLLRMDPKPGSGGGQTSFNNYRNDIDFIVSTDDYYGTLFVDGDDNTVIIGAQDFDSSPAASELATKGYGGDVKIMLSGTIGSKNQLATRGVVLINGDATVSGSLYDAYNRKFVSVTSDGFVNTAGTGSISLNSLAESGTIAVGDSFAFIDADDSNATKKGSVADLVTAIAGDGLTNASNQLQVGVDGSTIERSGDAVRVKDAGITSAKLNTAVAGDGITGGGGSALAVDIHTGVKIHAGNSKLMTDDAIVAHLTGSQFNGTLGVTGTLGVAGDLNVTEYIRHTADADTNIQFAPDAITFTVGNLNAIKLIEDVANSEIVINDGGSAYLDFRVESENKTHAIYVDSDNDYVSFGDPSSGGVSGKGVRADNSLFISGSVDGVISENGLNAPGGVTLFGGDVVISGSLLNASHVPIYKKSFVENGTFTTAPQATNSGNSVAIGNAAEATHTGAFAFGNRARAWGARSVALGSALTDHNTASGISAAALGGDDITASGDFSVVLGGQTNVASGDYSVVIGRTNTVAGDDAIAIGKSLTVPEANSIAIGNSTDNAKVVVSGSLKVKSTSTFVDDVTLDGSADLIIPGYIKHKSDTNTWIQFNTDRIRFNTDGATRVDITDDQVLILSGGHSTSPNPAAGTDVNFFVSGTIGSKDSAIKGTSVFGGDLHISGALSGPSQYALTDNNVRIFRDGNTMKFVDGLTTTKTLEDLATVNAQAPFIFGVDGNTSVRSKLKTTASISFAGDLDDYVTGLANPTGPTAVGTDVFFFVSGTLGAKDGATRHAALFGGDTIVSGTFHNEGDSKLTNVSGSNFISSNIVVASGSLIAGGNVIKNSGGNTNIKFSNSTAGVLFGALQSGDPQTFVDIRKDDNTIIASGVDGNDFSNYNIALRNHSTTTNAFAGIAFDVADVEDPDTIGASIAALRDSTADSNNHDTNLIFMTNDAGDDGLSERLRITHDGKIGIGNTDPATSFHIGASDSLVIPVGNTGARGTATQGGIRYNTTTSTFEGYNGSSWGSLGGTQDVDQDTYVGAETSAGSDNDDLVFYTAGTQRASIDNTGVAAFSGSLEAQAGINVTATGAIITGSLKTEKSSDVILSANNGGINIDKDYAIHLKASTGKIGIHNANPLHKIHILNDANAAGFGGGNNSLVMETVNASYAGAFIIQRAKGTIGSKALATNSTLLGELIFEGHDGTDYEPAAAIKGEVSHTTSANNDMPGLLSFWTTADGATSLTERMHINHAGQIVAGTVGTWMGNDEKLLVRQDWTAGNTPIPQIGVYNGTSKKFVLNVDPVGDVGIALGHASNYKVTVSGSLEVTQDIALQNLQLMNNIIKASDGGNTITLDTSDNVTIGNELTVGGNAINNSEGTNTIVMDTDEGVRIAGKLTVGGNELAFASAASLIKPGASSGTNQAGSVLDIESGKSTGNASGGNINFAVSSPGGSGTSVNAPSVKMHVDRNGLNMASNILMAGNDITSASPMNITSDGAMDVETTTGNLGLKATANNADITFTVDDNGADITALTLDGSDYASAKFTGADGAYVEVNDAGTDGYVKLFGSGLMQMYRHADSTISSAISFYKSRGNESSQSAVQSGDNIGSLQFYGYDDGASMSAKISVVAAADHNSSSDATDSPGQIEFHVTPDGSATVAKALTIESDKNLTMEGNRITFGNDEYIHNETNGDIHLEASNTRISGKLTGAANTDPVEMLQRRAISFSASMTISSLDGGTDKLWMMGGGMTSNNDISGDPDLDTSDAYYGQLMPYDYTIKEIVFTSTHYQNASHTIYAHRKNATETSTDTSITTNTISSGVYLGTSAAGMGQVQRYTCSIAGTAGQTLFLELSAVPGDVYTPGTSSVTTSGTVYLDGYIIVEEDTTTLYS